MAEIVDVYDDNLKKIGTKSRVAVHRDGDWHRVFHCWVIYRDTQGQDWLILQKRAPDKETYPDFLDVSAGGHYEAGESAVDGLRELEEELGLIAKFEDLIPVGQRVAMTKTDDLFDREVADVFLYICDQPLVDYRYQQDELAGLVALNIEQGLALFAGDVESVQAPAVGFATPTVTVSIPDFVPTKDDYFYKVLILAKRCLDSEKHLRI